mgnify:FL=1|jgi:hypothetical protein
MNNSNVDLVQIARNTTNKLINLQYKIDLLRKTNKNELIYLIRYMMSKDKKS